LATLLAALETIYNISVTNAERQKAQELCESLKRDRSAPLYGYILAHKDNKYSDVVRHFGLGLIESAVRYKWTDGSMDDELKAQIRQNVISLASEGTRPILEEQMFIKEKVAMLFVEVAKRQWPGEWDDMDFYLQQMFFKDETTREISLLILRCLCEDVCIYDDAVAGLRKKDLRAGLIVIMASESVLKRHYPEGVKGHKNEITLMVGQPGNDGWISRISALLTELLPRCQSETPPPGDTKIALIALATLVSSLDWVITTYVENSNAAAECYDVLASRTYSDDEKEKIIWPLVDKGGIDIVSKAYLSCANQMLQGDAYAFVQKLVQATVNLGEIQICGKRNAHTPEGLSKFLHLIYAMSSHPSILISSIASYFWTTILQHEKFSKDPNVHSFVPPLLELYATYLAKDYENRRQNDPVYKHFASVDFDSVTEFRTRASQTFQKAVDVIHLGVPVVPLDAFMWVANKVSEALKIPFPADIANHASYLSIAAKDSATFQSFDGTMTLMEVTVSSLKEFIGDSSNSHSTQVLSAMNALLGMLIGYDVRLFKAVEYSTSTGSTSDVKELRRRAAMTLVKIARAIPNTLFPIYEQIESAVQRLIEQNLIWLGEKRTLLCFLLVIALNADMAHNKAAVFEKIVLPVIHDFQSPALHDALSDPKKFIAFIGADELSPACSKTLSLQELEQLQTTIIQRRTQLSWSIETLLAFINESATDKDPLKKEFWVSSLGHILPNLLFTIRCLNAVLNPALWVGYAPDMAALLNMSPDEKEMLVTGKYPNTSNATLTLTKFISDLKIWMSVVRGHAYKLLSQVSTLGPAFYSIPMLQNLLEQSLFEHLDAIDNRQLRFFVNFAVHPLVLNCPPEYMGPIMLRLLGVFLPYLDQRLLKDWKLAADEGLVMDEKEEQAELDVSDEIVREILLRDLTRSLVDFVIAMVDFGKPKSTNVGDTNKQLAPTAAPAGGKEITKLALFVLSNESLSRPIIQLICHILTFKDTRSCVKATEAALCVLTALVQSYPSTADIIQVFSTMVLLAALEAIHDSYHQEGQDRLILLITEVYVEVRAFDLAPKLAFQQLPGIDMAQLESFEVKLSECSNKTKKHAIVRNFLQGIIGVAKSEWFKQREQGNRPQSSRTIAGTYEKPSQNVLDSAHEDDIGEGLANLFG
ncbi:hypothetical protein BGZ94_003109, partial [Podila epigama]